MPYIFPEPPYNHQLPCDKFLQQLPHKSSLHASFNLQAVDTTVQDIIHMLYHTEILGVEDISSSLILKYRHIFTRTFFFHNRIFPTTRMCACPLIRISSNQIIAEQASSGIRNTHCSMNKSLDFHIIRNMFTDLTDFFQRKFPCRYDTFRAELIPETVCLIVCIVCLCTDMAFYFRTNFTGIGKIPGSAMISASGFSSFSSCRYSLTPGRSSLCARIFTVT